MSETPRTHIYGVKKHFSGKIAVESAEVRKDMPKTLLIDRYVLWDGIHGDRIPKEHSGIAWTPKEALLKHLCRLDAILQRLRAEETSVQGQRRITRELIDGEQESRHE